MGLPATVSDIDDTATVELTASTPAAENHSIFRKPMGRHSRAERREKGAVPWLSTVKLSWGLEVRLLNISSSGLLLESGSKLTPGNVTELKLCGPDTEIVIPVRFVRSEVAIVDHLGVKYHTAATFEKALSLVDEPSQSRETASPTLALSDLLADVSTELGRHAHSSLRMALERSVRQAVGAQEIQIRDRPLVPNDGGRSICFTIPTGEASPPILQAIFATGTAPTGLDLRLLKAAASLAALLHEFDEHR